MQNVIRRKGLIISFIYFFISTALITLYGCSSGGGGGGSNPGNGSNPGTTSTIVANGTVGSSGGIVAVASNSSSSLRGAQTVIPPGALQNDTNITISEVTSPPEFATSSTATNNVIDFGPNGTTFNEPVIITLPYDSKNLTDENNLGVFTYNEAEQRWQADQVENIDTQNKLITARVSHFSNKTTQSNPSYYNIQYLVGSDRKIAVRTVLSQPFDQPSGYISLSIPEQLCSHYQFANDLLYLTRGHVSFQYDVTLMEKGSVWDSELETQTIEYKQINYSGSYQVNVYKNGSYWFTKGLGYNWGNIVNWYSGYPALFMFSQVPVQGKKYYVKVTLKITDDWCYTTTKPEYSDRANAADLFSNALTVSNYDSNGDGVVNGYVINVPDNTTPTPPTSLTATAVSSSQINLSWAASSDANGVVAYYVYPKGSLSSTSVIGTSTSVTGLSASTNYCYTVVAYDAALNASASSNEACATTKSALDTTPPTTPTGLSAIAVSQTQISLSWTASSDNVGVKGYKIYINNGTTPSMSASGTSLSLYGLTTGTTYCYNISAYDAMSNESGQSNQACAITLPGPDTTPPTTPGNLSATAISQTQIVLSWSAATDNVGVKAYRLFRNDAPAVYRTVSDTLASDSGLTPGTQYCYQVAAYDAANNQSGKTGQVCATTLSSTYSISGTITTGSAGLGDVVVTLAGSGIPTIIAKTDINGVYSFTNLASGSYTVTPTLSGYSFNQPSIIVPIIGADITGQNFTATASSATYTISGTVTSGGVGLAGVTVTLSGTGSTSATTDANGNYAFSGAQNGSYTLTPSLSGYTFSPLNIAVTVNGVNVLGQNFSAAINTVTFIVSGMVTSSGVGLPGVTVTLSGAGIGSTTTDVNGSYSFSSIQNGSYNLTAAKNGYSINPTSISVTVNGSNMPSQNFTAQVATVIPMKIPDTGQTACYDTAGNTINCAGTGQDGAYSFNPPSYTDNGDGTITDNITGLIWQKQDDATNRIWNDANTYCSNNTVGLPGTGWRLPTRMELLTIIGYGRSNPSINASYFTNTAIASYWSADSVKGYDSISWIVAFDLGYAYMNDNSYPYPVRCVRGQTATPIFHDNGDGTVTDNNTGLMWQKQDDGLGHNWNTALSYCEGLSLGGYNDWRLPNVKELGSLTDVSRSDPTISPLFLNTTPYYPYWTSTTFVDQTMTAWCVGFTSDRQFFNATGIIGYLDKTYLEFVRCVRGGQ